MAEHSPSSDIRRSSDTKAKPMAELDGHAGPVKLLQMDAYKIVTGGPDDSYVNVWEAETGGLVNSLMYWPSDLDSGFGCSAMAVQVCRIVTAGGGGQVGLLRYRDMIPACQYQNSGVLNLAVALRHLMTSFAIKTIYSLEG